MAENEQVALNVFQTSDGLVKIGAVHDLGEQHDQVQGFGRGLCIIEDSFLAAGSSPSTVTLYDLAGGGEVARVNFSMDIRNAIHGLEVWPY